MSRGGYLTAQMVPSKLLPLELVTAVLKRIQRDAGVVFSVCYVLRRPAVSAAPAYQEGAGRARSSSCLCFL